MKSRDPLFGEAAFPSETVTFVETSRYPESRPAPPVLQSQSWLNIAVCWAPEILACITSIGLLVTIAAVLRAYDGISLLDWPYGITINALVSILVIMMKAAMMVPLAEGLSQLKWSWFRKPVKLYDLALIDAASRGAVGAGRAMFHFIPR